MAGPVFHLTKMFCNIIWLREEKVARIKAITVA